MEDSPQFQGNYMAAFKAEKAKKSFPGEVKSWEAFDRKLEVHCEETILVVEAVTDELLRFRYANYGRFEEDFSYAIIQNDSLSCNKFVFTEKKKQLEVETEKLTCVINRKTLQVTISDPSGFVIMEDELGYHWEEDKKHGNNIVIKTCKIHSRESFYGLGDKSGRFNLRDQRLQLWGSDQYGYEEHTDPLYKNIPFFYGLHHKIGYGVFMDNTFRSFFDFGFERENVFSFWAHGGEMNFYFIYGPELLSVAEKYTHLTGTPELPPLWSLGFHQSKWSYYPEKVVRELAQEFRTRKIPCDVIHIDIDYMDGYRCFTWDKKKFPNPKKMLGDLAKQGFKPIAIIDPGIKVDREWDLHEEAVEKDYFCKWPDGPLYRGSVWPGACHFPDFTDSKVREWWAGLFPELMASGLWGIWNDMNEPAVFEEGTFADDVRHDFDGHPCSHRKAHNVYGMQMAKASFDGVKESINPKRPFVLTRSAYAGTQRYAAAWTGDNIASWNHLKIANIQVQRLAVSGMSFAGSDVGGFINEPSPELFVRWIQLGIFHPFFRVHSSGDHGEQEPWSFGEETELQVKQLIELRYQLLPYLYTAFWQYVTAGTPILRPLCFLDQTDFETIQRSEEFVCGDHILVSPISRPEAEGEWVYIPQGEWIYYWTDDLYKGMGEEIWIESMNAQVPFFVRAGSVIPLFPVQLYVGEKELEVITLHIYFSKNSVISKWYEDSGDGYDYENDQFRLHEFKTSGSETEFIINHSTQGSYSSPTHTFNVHVHCCPFTMKQFMINGEETEAAYDKNRHIYTCAVPSDFDNIQLIATS